MSLLLYKALAAIIILLTSLVSGVGPLRAAKANPHHYWLGLGEALAGGIFLGIAFFHMLPEAQADLHAAYGDVHYPVVNLLCVLGFVVLLFLERVILQMANETRKGKRSLVPYVLPIVLSVHALTEGAALGINTTLADITLIFIAIIVHKGSESFALATSLGKSHLPLARSMPIFLIWALMSPFGVLLGSALAEHLQTHQGEVTAAVFNAFAAGTFLYIATLHKASHVCTSEHNHHFYEFLLFLLGLGLMAVVEIWV
jgi:zinc transporter ZupT